MQTLDTHYHGKGRWLWAVCVPLLVLLAACGAANANATPTTSVQSIYTAAFETFSAQQATQLALTPPTNTPLPTSTATLPLPPSPIATLAFVSPTLGGVASACDSAVFAGDVTIPDNTVVQAGKKFTKTWKLLNKGSCTWDTNYKLAFDHGDQMGGVTTAIKVPVASGSVAEISVDMVAPSSNGTYQGWWRMQNGSNQSFGDTPWVLIKVGNGGTAATATAGPSPTAGAGTYTISGSVNVADFTLEFDTINAVPTVTYTSGGYSFSVPSGWSGTITPTKGNPGHWMFTPTSKTFTNVSSNQTQDFTGVPVTPTQ